jgi:SAM-dependent methyltransferase
MATYGEDLAYIHDTGFGHFAQGSGPGVLEFLRGNGIDSGLVVDLGCGSGIWARELVDAGYAVLGVDFSADMLQLAGRRVPEGEFRQGSFLEVDLPKCVAVTAMGEVFNYRFDEGNGIKALARLFRHIHRALQPGGLLIFDVIEPGAARRQGPARKFALSDDWACLVEVEEDTRRARLTRRITSFRRVGELFRREEEIHHLQLYRGREIAQELRRVGFRVRVLRGYGTFRFRPAHVGFLGRQP